MNVRRRQVRELGNVAPDELALGIEAFGLQGRIEDADKRRGVGAAASAPLPAQRVVGQVGVDQGVPEPACTDLPGDEQVLDQEGCDGHTYTVVHPAGLPQLAHAGVDQRVAGASALPGAAGQCDRARQSMLAKLASSDSSRAEREVDEHVVGKLTPAEFTPQDVGGAPLGGEVRLGERVPQVSTLSSPKCR